MATAGPNRSGSALGVPVPSMTTRVRGDCACGNATTASMTVSVAVSLRRTRILARCGVIRLYRIIIPMAKQAISVTLDSDNLTWLKGRAGAAGLRSVSELLDQIVTAAREGGRIGPA